MDSATSRLPSVPAMCGSRVTIAWNLPSSSADTLLRKRCSRSRCFSKAADEKPSRGGGAPRGAGCLHAAASPATIATAKATAEHAESAERIFLRDLCELRGCLRFASVIEARSAARCAMDAGRHGPRALPVRLKLSTTEDTGDTEERSSRTGLIVRDLRVHRRGEFGRRQTRVRPRRRSRPNRPSRCLNLP